MLSHRNAFLRALHLIIKSSADFSDKIMREIKGSLHSKGSIQNITWPIPPGLDQPKVNQRVCIRKSNLAATQTPCKRMRRPTR